MRQRALAFLDPTRDRLSYTSLRGTASQQMRRKRGPGTTASGLNKPRRGKAAGAGTPWRGDNARTVLQVNAGIADGRDARAF